MENPKMLSLSNLLAELSENIIEFKLELKKGNFSNVRIKNDKLFSKYKNGIKPSLNLIESPIYGINIQLVGITSSFLFPASLYNNSFRIKILKELNQFINTYFTIEELGLFLSKK